jgi:hypothetical protein
MVSTFKYSDRTGERLYHRWYWITKWLLPSDVKLRELQSWTFSDLQGRADGMSELRAVAELRDLGGDVRFKLDL